MFLKVNRNVSNAKAKTIRDGSDIRVVMKEDLVNWNEVVR